VLELVQTVGAAAGVAAGVGVPALSALYVSQAREVRRLRERAGRAPERSRSRHRQSVVAALAVLLVLGGTAIYGIARLTGAGAHDSTQADRGSSKKPKRKAAAIDPGSVSVAVLNGTTVPGLAASLRDRLAAAGFAKGTIGNYSDPRLAASVVQYAPGRRPEAKAVAGRLGISRREPVTAGTRALAPDATVIVIAGADIAP
jgi:LytR cell envelope-related transcriptional attenuator